MYRLTCFAVIILSVSLSCTPAKNTTTNPDNRLPSPDSFKTADLLFLTPEKQLLYYQNAEHILPTNKIEAGKNKYLLTERLQDLSGFTFKYKDTVRSLNEFIKATKVVGIIVVKKDTVLFEHYGDGTGRETKWITFSVAKSVTSLLYGAALQDGYITSLDHSVTKYLPELAGSVYDSVFLHNLLQMSSGVKWHEDPRNPESDLVKVARMEKEGGWTAAFNYLSQLSRAAPAGTKFNYNTIETTLAGLILSRATGKTLSTYLSERIWKPFGMYDDANWVRSRTLNLENGGCCISATLRDYALLGIFALKNGVSANGKSLLPETWMQTSTTSAKSYKGYGYYWWLHPNRRYFASGSFGQQIEIDPSQKAVIAIQSYWPIAFNNYYVGYMDSFIEAVLASLKEK